MSLIDEQAAAYDASRSRIDALARPLDDASLSRTVQCCPAWTVKDLVGHLAGLLEDRRDGHMPTGSFNEWTSAQVARHREEPVAELLDGWHGLPVTRTEDPPSLAALSFDVVSHEHDLCQAIGVEGVRDSESVRLGAHRAVDRMASMLAKANAPGVRLSTDEGVQLVEGASPTIGLTTTPYAFMRLVTGRVSRAQAEAMGWDGDADPVLDALFADGFFTLQPVDVLEADLT